MIQTKSYAANTHVANVPCSSQKGLAKETFAELKIEGHPISLHLWLTDIEGRAIFTLFNGKIDSDKLKLALPRLSSGLYFLNIKADGKLLPVQKISIN